MKYSLKFSKLLINFKIDKMLLLPSKISKLFFLDIDFLKKFAFVFMN